MGKGPKTKHGIHLCLKPTLYITFSKGSYMHLVIVCMKQFWCGVLHLWCSDSQKGLPF